jgi:EAL domain-containing protein (putative c-di-GMP-specific phosphodiesterase class I)
MVAVANLARAATLAGRHGSFIKGILHSPTERTMVESINQIAHVMGRQTIVEFVEDEAVLASFRAMGVDFVQSYGVGRPQPLQAAQVVDVE